MKKELHNRSPLTWPFLPLTYSLSASHSRVLLSFPLFNFSLQSDEQKEEKKSMKNSDCMIVVVCVYGVYAAKGRSFRDRHSCEAA